MNIVNFEKPEGAVKYHAHVSYKDGSVEEHIVEGINPEDNIVWLVHDDEALTLVAVANLKSITVTPIKGVQ